MKVMQFVILDFNRGHFLKLHGKDSKNYANKCMLGGFGTELCPPWISHNFLQDQLKVGWKYHKTPYFGGILQNCTKKLFRDY